MKRVSLCCLILMVAYGGTGCGEGETKDNPLGSARIDPDQLKILFRSDREGSTDFFVMNANGSNIVNLAPTVSDIGPPSWSPDGLRLVFKDGESRIYVVDADGSDLVKLLDGFGSLNHPVWSSDGTQIRRERSGQSNQR